MPSGIYIDDEFIGVSWHGVQTYFDVLRKVIDSGRSRALLLPGDVGVKTYLITPYTKLTAYVEFAETEGEYKSAFDSEPFGNFPAIAADILDADYDGWDLLDMTDLGAKIREAHARRVPKRPGEETQAEN